MNYDHGPFDAPARWKKHNNAFGASPGATLPLWVFNSIDVVKTCFALLLTPINDLRRGRVLCGDLRFRGQDMDRTINDDPSDIKQIAGLSLAGHARPAEGRAEVARILALGPLRYPDSPPLLNYGKGFGHSDLVTV